MKPTAVIDKSVLQRICSQPDAEQQRVREALMDRYDLVIPFILIEEIALDVGLPPVGSLRPVSAMLAWVADERVLRMADVYEIAFQELVMEGRIRGFQHLPADILARALQEATRAPEFASICRQRRTEQREDRALWRKAQHSLMPRDGAGHCANAQDFFTRLVEEQFGKLLGRTSEKRAFLEGVFGGRFRSSHRASEQAIDGAFERYTAATSAHYANTTRHLLARLAYFLAPCAHLPAPGGSTPAKLITMGDQWNSVSDEQYVVAAFFCDRLLTADAGMRNIASVFEQVGLWKGHCIHLDPSQALEIQIATRLK